MLMASERTINVVSPTLDDEWCIYAEPIERRFLQIWAVLSPLGQQRVWPWAKKKAHQTFALVPNGVKGINTARKRLA